MPNALQEIVETIRNNVKLHITALFGSFKATSDHERYQKLDSDHDEIILDVT